MYYINLYVLYIKIIYIIKYKFLKEELNVNRNKNSNDFLPHPSGSFCVCPESRHTLLPWR